MAYFDTFDFARRLKGAGFDDAQVVELVELAKASVPPSIVTEEVLERELERGFLLQDQRLTIRLGGIVVVSLGILFGLLRMFPGA